MPDFSIVWSRIADHADESFLTKRGLEFTYEEAGGYIVPSRTRYRLSKGNFERAYKEVPFDGPGVVNATVRGPAYVWAILHDRRIRQGDW